jgi:ribosome recycling factor
MNEELDLIFEEAKEHMEKSLEYYIHELSGIRAGKASPVMLESVEVEYYGTMTPLNQVANVNVRDSQTLTVQVWDRRMLQTVEKAIRDANLGFNPVNNGELLIINVPPLTEERRKQLAKKAREEAEKARINIRNIRKDAKKHIEKLEKDKIISEDMTKQALDDLQELTDSYIKKIDEKLAKKEEDILTV